MDFKKLSKHANKIIAKRGGTAALKGDAQELAAIAKGKGSASQKAKAAALLQPLAKLAGDARRITDQIDADLPPDVLSPAIIPTDDP